MIRSRMQRLTLHSQPTTPSTAGPLFDRRSLPVSATTSAQPTPIAPRHSTPASPVTSRQAEIEHEAARGRTPYLGRSVSEPRSLSHLADRDGDFNSFASHQIPRGVSGLAVIARGRPRSATAFERMSPIVAPRHSRSQPLSRADSDAQLEADHSGEEAQWELSEDEHQEARHEQEEVHTEQAPEGEAGGGSRRASGASTTPYEGDVSGELEPEERDREVVRVNLGLRGLGTVGGSAQRRGRRGRSSRGRGSGSGH